MDTHKLPLKLALFWLFACLVSSLAHPKDNAALRISTSLTERPSSIMSQKILTQAYAKLGLKLVFVATPEARARVMWEAQEIDGFDSRFTTVALPDSIKVKVAVAYEDGVVFTVHQHFVVSDYDSLKPYVVGYIAGTPYMLDKLKDVPRKEPAQSVESMFLMLQAGRTDIAIDSRFSLCFAKRLGLKQIVVLEPSIDKGYGYHYLSIKHQALVDPLEAILRSMEKDGTIKKIQEEVMHDFLARCN